MERAEGASRGPELIAGSDDAKSNDYWIYLRDASIYGKSRDTSRDMTGEVGRSPLLHVPPSNKATPSLPKT